MTKIQTFNPATQHVVWQGEEASPGEIDNALKLARKQFIEWSQTPFEQRAAILNNYSEIVRKESEDLAHLIAEETGKPLWESKGEVAAVIQKVPISIKAYLERCPAKEVLQSGKLHAVNFRPHGVVAVFGPFNFPAHLPNGHIVPALLAGNCVIFKPSEKAAGVGAKLHKLLIAAGVPAGAMQVVQGGPAVGQILLGHKEIDGIFFTGSATTGIHFNEMFAKTPGKILALEMGGNNPLIVSGISDLKAAVYTTIQSAFITAGQRCSCARRLILTPKANPKAFLDELISQAKALKIGKYTEVPEPFMGPVIDLKAASALLKTQQELESRGAIVLLKMRQLAEKLPFVTPAIIDTTAMKEHPDEECFGPFLQVIRVDSLNAAIDAANNTRYGLTAGLLSDSREEWQAFFPKIRAGIINWNTALTGASSEAPFGGVGISGNNRPSAYLAADYCSYPIASAQMEKLQLPTTLLPGIKL